MILDALKAWRTRTVRRCEMPVVRYPSLHFEFVQRNIPPASSEKRVRKRENVRKMKFLSFNGELRPTLSTREDTLNKQRLATVVSVYLLVVSKCIDAL